MKWWRCHKFGISVQGRTGCDAVIIQHVSAMRDDRCQMGGLGSAPGAVRANRALRHRGRHVRYRILHAAQARVRISEKRYFIT